MAAHDVDETEMSLWSSAISVTVCENDELINEIAKFELV
jgi:hypothetical protein